MAEHRVEVLNLPILPVEWVTGSVKLSVITTKGGTLKPKLRNSRTSMEIIEDFNHEDGSFDPTAAKAFRSAAYEINHGIEPQIYVERDESELEFGFVSWEEYKDIKKSIQGDLIDGFLLLEKQNPPYQVTPQKAYKAFQYLAKVGGQIISGNDQLESLVSFISTFGIPEDREQDIPSADAPINAQHIEQPSPGIVITTAIQRAKLAYICWTLWKHILDKRNADISEMAKTIDVNNNSHVTFLGNLNPIPIQYSPQKEDNIWRVHARNWLYGVVTQQIERMYVKPVEKTTNVFTIGIQPGGLQSAMWLEFATRIYGADDPHEGMRQCKHGGKFHGCGEWYYPSGPDDRSNYCPTCRAKAGAERVARFRAKP